MIEKLHENWKLIVAIGSSERRNERSDPFSGAERKSMLESYLKELDVQGVRVVTLRDGPSVSWAVDNLIRRCKPDALFLSTEREALIELARHQVRVVRFRRTGTVSSTRIRDSIADGGVAWKRLTGKSVATLISRLDGVRRIQEAYRGRTKKGGPGPLLGGRVLPLDTSTVGRPKRRRTVQ